MAITYVGAGAEASATAGGDPAVPYPAGIQAGDLLWLPCSASVATAFGTTAVSGFTRRYALNAGGGSPVGAGFYKIATGSETGTVTLNSPGGLSIGRMFAYRGVDQATPFDVADAAFGSSTGVTAYVIPDQSTTVVGCTLLLHTWSNATSGTWTQPGGYAELMDSTAGGTVNATSVAHLVAWGSSGATGTRTVTRSASSRGGAAGVVLRPASAAPGQGSGTGTVTVSGAGSGARTPVADGAGAVVTSGAGVGVRNPVASGTGTIAASGTGTGVRIPVASGSRTVSVTGTGTGRRVAQASGVGTVTATGTGTGTRAARGTGLGVVTITGSGIGHAPTVGGASGSGSGTVVVTGTGTGVRTPKASGLGVLTVTGSGTGHRQPVATGVGTVVIVGAGVGTQPDESTDFQGRIHAARLSIPTASGTLATATATGRLSTLAATGEIR